MQVTEQQLRAIFQPYGEIVYVKIPSGKGCGFVQFTQRSNAETAMLQMNGQVESQRQRLVRTVSVSSCNLLLNDLCNTTPCQHHAAHAVLSAHAVLW